MVMGDGARFTTSQTVVLNGSGNGQVRFAPVGESWHVTATTVKASTSTIDAQAKIYQRQVLDSCIVDNGTYSGSSGDTSDTDIYLTDGEPMFVVWTGGDAGATATATIQGWKSMPQGGFRARVN